ncbi:MAG: hypothetical protein AB7O24_27000 [Kofleriaceae bacterium]
MSIRIWLPLIVTVVATVTVRPAIADEPSVSAAIIEVSATSGKERVVDPDLKPLEKKLKQAPFASWNQFRVLMKTQKTLVKKKAEPLKLKVGSATITLVEIVDKSKCRINATMSDDKGKQILSNTSAVEAGDYVVYGHPLPNNDGHLLAVTCK